nr:hypothetical protein LKV13_04740 [Borrelia sp. BU AG58]
MFRNVNTDVMNYIMETISIHSAMLKGLESIYAQQKTLLEKVGKIEKSMEKRKLITVKKTPKTKTKGDKKDIIDTDLIEY